MAKNDKDKLSVVGKAMLLIGIVAQTTLSLLVGRYTRHGVPPEKRYVAGHLVMMVELGKFLCSNLMEWWIHRGDDSMSWARSLQYHVLDRPWDALKLLIPAALYWIQNNLHFVVLTHLTAPVSQVTYQAKLVLTAIVSVIMLGRRYTTVQFICIVAVSAGVIIVILDQTKDEEVRQSEGQSLVKGLVATTCACLCSAFASVYFEKIIKKKSAPVPPPPASNGAKDEESVDLLLQKTQEPELQASVWMRNIQLSFFSITLAFSQHLYQLYKEDTSKSFFHGFTISAWCLAAIMSAGGLIVAAAIKYTDNVIKGLTNAIAVVVSTLASAVVFHTTITIHFVTGSAIILGAVYLFGQESAEAAKLKNQQAKADGTSGSSEQGGQQQHHLSRRIPIIVLAIFAMLGLGEEASSQFFSNGSVDKAVVVPKDEWTANSAMSSTGTGTMNVMMAVFALPDDDNEQQINNEAASSSSPQREQLSKLCETLEQYKDISTAALGDQSFIRSVAKCKNLLSPPYSVYTLGSLNYDYVSTIPFANNCAEKFQGSAATTTTSLTVSKLKIWLNKIDVLCRLAEQRPKEWTVLLDAHVTTDTVERLVSMVLPSLQQSTSSMEGLVTPTYESKSIAEMKFGMKQQEQCQHKHIMGDQFLTTKSMMGIQGKDCPAVLGAYRQSLTDYIQKSATELKCPCFDDETILSHALTLNPEVFRPFSLMDELVWIDTTTKKETTAD